MVRAYAPSAWRIKSPFGLNAIQFEINGTPNRYLAPNLLYLRKHSFHTQTLTDCSCVSFFRRSSRQRRWKPNGPASRTSATTKRLTISRTVSIVLCYYISYSWAEYYSVRAERNGFEIIIAFKAGGRWLSMLVWDLFPLSLIATENTCWKIKSWVEH